MKYMGSKRWMLQNGLGSVLNLEAARAKRFVDLFAGSGVVAGYVAQKLNVPVLAFDLQKFSTVLTQAVISRTRAFSPDNIWKLWQQRARKIVDNRTPLLSTKITKATVEKCRDWCEDQKGLPITRAYGGHYFSPTQSVWIDALRRTLPKKVSDRTAALAALIQAASQCAAAPGHTAQPFQSTRTAKKFLQDAWGKDIVERTRDSLCSLAAQHANCAGRANVVDANKAAKGLREGDLAFIDPPYSGVHYSRFYHVLETIARGECGAVEGVGRYPAPMHRPRSKYSIGTQSAEALDDLLETVSSKGARAILTFPDHECSNGLSGNLVRKTAKKYFKIREKVVKSKFSTLGGNGRLSKTGKKGRGAKRKAKELILVLKPKSS
jgi:adenine-specific DNA methylase